MIKMGVPGERCYYPAEELVWDASRDSSPRSLRTCLAAHYGLSPDSLLLAKYHPDKHTWEELSNWVRGGERTASVVNLSPHYKFKIHGMPVFYFFFVEPAGFKEEEKEESGITARGTISSQRWRHNRH